MNRIKLRQMLTSFFNEDIGDRDITSETIFSPSVTGKGAFIAKEAGIIAGLSIIHEGYHLLNPSIEVKAKVEEGMMVKKGQIIAEVEGPVTDLLTGERVILNLVQRMSGIASLTNKAVQLIGNSSTRLVDTRKTTPGLRMLEKYAVRCGGAFNHRNGLYDAVMMKDNHIAYCGSIVEAVQAVRDQIGHMVKIEIETETEWQVQQAVEAGVDVIMFDNRTPQEIEALLPLVPSHIVTEASGGISLENISEYGQTGVNYISLGMLTHSAKALDISFRVQVRKQTTNE
ncbi:carboxylating nicotinate-nucleotide diphosphorylase [Bacillus sp. HMF5848]|uniref:carboxylating nicotinate-nucleotide diphosphorylase n=1 Tax=Bacillus sp. HMF5848 TaxID=2495421 RepID=UPI000F797490|nr:carboxylating nicotinate-nucleotide diphosphorylase [Bacillus sp. HMF5848]RSK25734.1 carboxylating nicotinate-nucleotide diphosphorylase [Bacillus sp. HMF5848]